MSSKQDDLEIAISTIDGKRIVRAMAAEGLWAITPVQSASSYPNRPWVVTHHRNRPWVVTHRSTGRFIGDPLTQNGAVQLMHALGAYDDLFTDKSFTRIVRRVKADPRWPEIYKLIHPNGEHA